MGPVRHRQLICLLAVAVALDLSAGVVALYTRGGTASAAERAGLTSRTGDGDAAGHGTDGAAGILAGGQFTRRRGSGRQSTGATAEGAAGTAAAPASPAGSSPSTGSAPAPDGSTTTSSTGRPTTTSTGRRVTSSTAPPATSSTSRPGTTAGPAAGSDGTGAPAPSGSDRSPPTSAPADARPTNATFKDPAGDTVVQGTGTAKAERRADIVQSHVTYAPNGLVFAVLTDDPVDPGQDPHWASDSTFVSWELDTNGDAVADYEVEYAFSDGTPIAGVSRPGETDGTLVCEAEAAYTAERYAVAVDPACIGQPASVSYRVTMYYDTDPNDENADLVTDVAPDGGLSRPVARPAR